MAIKFNNNEVKDVKFNGNDVDVLQYNGETVWERETLPAGTVIFEKSAYNKNGYTANIEVPGLYEVIVIGAGGGAAGSVSKSSAMPAYLATAIQGGSGGYIRALVNFPACALKITVGQHGSQGRSNQIGVGATSWNTWGSNGGNSFVSYNGTNILQANGGIGGNLTVTTKRSLGGGKLSDFVNKSSVGGESSYKSVTGITIKDVEALTGNAGEGALDGVLTSNITTSTYKVKTEPVDSNLTPYGRGQGMYCEIKGTSWSFTDTTAYYLATDGYVKITKA